MFVHRLIHRDFLGKWGVLPQNTDEKRHGRHVAGEKVIHSFPREKLWNLWIKGTRSTPLLLYVSSVLWIVFLRIRLLLNDGLDGIGDVDALRAVAVGERLDELVLDDALMVEHT